MHCVPVPLPPHLLLLRRGPCLLHMPVQPTSPKLVSHKILEEGFQPGLPHSHPSSSKSKSLQSTARSLRKLRKVLMIRLFARPPFPNSRISPSVFQPAHSPERSASSSILQHPSAVSPPASIASPELTQVRTSPFMPPSPRPSPLSNSPGKGCGSLQRPLAWYILLRC